MIKGGCHCRAVRYEIGAKPKFQFICLCADCRRLSAGGHLAAAVFDNTAIRISGELQTYSYPGGSGKPLHMSFCPACGTSLLAKQDEGPVSMVRAGTYDDPAAFMPQKILFAEERAPWDQTTLRVHPLRDHSQGVIPYLRVGDGDGIIAFLEKVFAAKVHSRLDRKDGSLWNAEVDLPGGRVMIGGVPPAEASPSMLYIYVKDVDETYARALEAGATSVMEPGDQFYGDRNGGVTDPQGNSWWLATPFEQVSDEEIKRRALEFEG